MERLEDTFLLIGRVLMAALFLPSGIGKAMGFEGFTKMLGGQGLPYPEVLAGIAIAIEILAPIALIIGVFPRITALVLIAFVIAATGIAHRFWEFAEPARRAQEISFYKNVGILGGLLFYFVSGAGAWALAGRGERTSRVAQTA